MIKKIKLNELSELINTKDNETARQWCLSRGVEIFGKNARRYVLELDIAEALDTEVITYLINKYGFENWAEVYKLYCDNNFEGVVNLKYAALLKKGSKQNEKYVAKSNSANKFLNDVA